MLVTPEKKMGRKRKDATEFFGEMVRCEGMVRGDDFQFPRSIQKTPFKFFDFMKMDKFFFYSEVICCPEPANNDPIVFEIIRRPGTEKF